MDVNEAREIVEKTDPEKGIATIPDWLEWEQAVGFLLGWNAAIKKSATVHNDTAGCHGENCFLCSECVQEILKLSIPTESLEPEKKSPQEGK